jgi:hypothetical protein
MPISSPRTPAPGPCGTGPSAPGSGAPSPRGDPVTPPGHPRRYSRPRTARPTGGSAPPLHGSADPFDGQRFSPGMIPPFQPLTSRGIRLHQPTRYVPHGSLLLPGCRLEIHQADGAHGDDLPPPPPSAARLWYRLWTGPFRETGTRWAPRSRRSPAGVLRLQDLHARAPEQLPRLVDDPFVAGIHTGVMDGHRSLHRPRRLPSPFRQDFQVALHLRTTVRNDIRQNAPEYVRGVGIHGDTRFTPHRRNSSCTLKTWRSKAWQSP